MERGIGNTPWASFGFGGRLPKGFLSKEDGSRKEGKKDRQT